MLPTTTGTVTIVDKSGNNYKLALADSSGEQGTPKWVKAKNATKATYQWDVKEDEGAAYVVNSDGQSINSYAAGSSVVLATLSGLNKDATTDDLNGVKIGDKDEEGNPFTSAVEKKVEVTEGSSNKAGTITLLSRNILGTTNVTLGSKDNYNLALGEDADFSAFTTAAQWNYDSKKGSATIVQGTAPSWAPKVNKDGTTDGKTMTYTKPAFTTLATVSGLSTELTYDADAGTITTVDADEKTVSLTFDPLTRVITVPTEALNGKNITLGKNDTYTLALADADGVAVKDTTPYFKWSNGKLEVIGGKDAGYTLKDGKTISYIKAAPKALATITGLNTDKDLKDVGTIVTSSDGKSIGFADEDGNFDERSVIATFSDSGVITINDGSILGKKKVTLKSDSYTLALGEDVDEAGEDDPVWVKDENKTFATYQKSLRSGYTLSSDLKTITFSDKEENVTVLATLSGLKKGEGYDAEGLGLNNLLNDGEAVLTIKEGTNGAAGTITILTNALTYLKGDDDPANGDYDIFSGNISIANKDNYTLVLENDKAFAPTNQAAQWDLKKGTANYSVTTTEGWVSKKDKNNIADGKNFIYSKQKSTNLASVTGLNSKRFLRVKEGDASTVQVSANDWANNATYEDIAGDNYTDLFSINDKVVTFGSTDSLTNKSKVTVKTLIKSESTPYTVAVADSLKPADLEDPVPYYKGTTVTLKKAQSAGWVVDEKTSATLSYKDVTGSEPVATIDGLAKGLKSDVINRIAFYNNNKTQISIPKEALGTTDVTLTDNSGTGYTLKLEDKINAPIYGDALWTCKSGTATLTQAVTGGYELSSDEKRITYVATKSDKNATVVTVSGLSKDLTTVPFLNSSDNPPVSVDLTTRIITVNAAALGTSKVTAKSADKNSSYTFKLGDDVIKDTDTDKWKGQTEWATSKGTATYKTYDKGYYTIDTKGAIVYNKESKGTTFMTLTGLNTASSIQSGTGYVVNETARTITINENGLTTKSIALKANDSTYSDYKLVLGLAEGHESLTSYESDGWTTSGATATLKGKITAGYALTNDKTITYSKDKTNQKFATVSGLKNGTTISDSNDGTITLSESDLNGKDVTLSVAVDESIVDGGKNFKLDFNGTAPEVSTEDSLKATWSTTKTKAVLKGSVSAGYILSASEKSITATKATAANKTQDLVTINGLNTGKSITGTISDDDAEARKVTINGDNLSNKVTVTGGAFEVSITSGFKDSSLIGSASADSISIGGSNVTVSTGKGDDYVKFASGNSNNVFLYASGDGNDVIADFTAKSDVIKVTKGAVSVKTATDGDGRDVIVSIDGNKGSIRLKGVAGSQINILDAKGTQTSYATTRGTNSSGAVADVLMSSNNFITSSAQLSSIVDGGSDYTVGSLNTTQNATDLTKQNDVVTYGGDK